MDINFLKMYTPHVTMVLQLLMYSCYGYHYKCLVKSTVNLDVINLNKIGLHKAFIPSKRITRIKVIQS